MLFDYPESNIRDGDRPADDRRADPQTSDNYVRPRRAAERTAMFVCEQALPSFTTPEPALRERSTTECWQEPKVWHSAPPRRVSQRTGKEGSQDQRSSACAVPHIFFFRGCDARCASIGGHSAVKSTVAGGLGIVRE